MNWVQMELAVYHSMYIFVWSYQKSRSKTLKRFPGKLYNMHSYCMQLSTVRCSWSFDLGHDVQTKQKTGRSIVEKAGKKEKDNGTKITLCRSKTVSLSFRRGFNIFAIRTASFLRFNDSVQLLVSISKNVRQYLVLGNVWDHTLSY